MTQRNEDSVAESQDPRPTPLPPPEAAEGISDRELADEEVEFGRQLAVEIEAEQGETLPAVMTATEAMSLAEIAVKALVGGSVNQYEAAMKIIRGHELGIGAAAAVENIFVVNNKTSMGSALVGALIKKSGKYNYSVRELTNESCLLEFTEGGEFAGESKFTMDDARLAGLVKRDSPWEKYPRNMLEARALTNGARWFCPDVFHGTIYTPEELHDVRVSASGAVVAGTEQGRMEVGTTPEGRNHYPQGLSEDELRNEPCPVHKGDVFFKKGQMRNHAHPTGPRGSKSPWCNYQDVLDDCKQEAVEILQEAGYDKPQMRAAVETTFPDLVDVSLPNYRIADWTAIADWEWEETTAPGEEETSDDTEGML